MTGINIGWDGFIMPVTGHSVQKNAYPGRSIHPWPKCVIQLAIRKITRILHRSTAMDKELLKINILSIAGVGFLILVTGLLLYLFKAYIVQYQRFFLPIPPIGVAVYVYVFNLYKNSNGNLQYSTWTTVRDVLYGTAIAALVFCAFSVILIIAVNYFKRNI